MRRIAIVAAFVGLALVPASGDSAPVGPVDLLTGFAAQEGCGCVFVAGQTDDYCTAYGQQPGYTVAMQIDHTAKTVTASYFISTRVARMGAHGCTLDPVPPMQ